MKQRCLKGVNQPITLNVVTFSGHGITYDGDSIAVIPEMAMERSGPHARFINMSAKARDLA